MTNRKTTAQAQAVETSRYKINYDIGIAIGVGWVGLLGPRSAKKLTILGESPGKAKRLETEAKMNRSLSGDNSPNIVVDESCYKTVKDRFPETFFEPRKSEIKNIHGDLVYYFDMK